MLLANVTMLFLKMILALCFIYLLKLVSPLPKLQPGGSFIILILCLSCSHRMFIFSDYKIILKEKFKNTVKCEEKYDS